MPSILTDVPPASPESLVAPWCGVPDVDIVSVEHPGVIKNIDSALLSLGSDSKIASFLEAEPSKKSIGLFLRHEDHFRKPINSHMVKTANIALRVTVPQRTGRKRKRGASDQPFTRHEHSSRDSLNDEGGRMLQSLRDNPATSCAEAIGFVGEAHRFRDAPDFQYSFASNSLAQQLRENVLTFDYERLKDFKLDIQTRGVQPRMDMIPPPLLSNKSVHFNYAYHQNPSIKLSHDESGKVVAVNTAIVPKTANQLVTFDVVAIPHTPSASLVAEESLEPRMQLLIKEVRAVFDERPILTRRVLFNRMPRERTVVSRKLYKLKTAIRDNEYDLKYALRYVCYMFRSGPWKDALIKLGIDPRTDPKYRVYQTMAFQVESRDKRKMWEDNRLKWARASRHTELDNESHLFDGKQITLDGKIWQACDVTDPMLRKFLDEDTLREVCDIQQDGWYNNGAWAKLRAIMRDKIQVIMAGRLPDEMDYVRVSYMPNIIDDTNLELALLASSASPKEQTLASQVRTLAKSLDALNKRYGLLNTSSEAKDVENVEINSYDNDEAGEQVTLQDATAITDDEDDDIDDDDDDDDEEEEDRLDGGVEGEEDASEVDQEDDED